LRIRTDVWAVGMCLGLGCVVLGSPAAADVVAVAAVEASHAVPPPLPSTHSPRWLSATQRSCSPAGWWACLFGWRRRATGGIQAPKLIHRTWSTLTLGFLPPLFSAMRRRRATWCSRMTGRGGPRSVVKE